MKPPPSSIIRYDGGGSHRVAQPICPMPRCWPVAKPLPMMKFRLPGRVLVDRAGA
jgi:hypothetical protein